MPGYLPREEQEALLEEVREAARQAPLYVPAMPRTGKEMSVRMTNCGILGWVTDKERGYRYQPTHPATGQPWPPIPDRLLRLWREVSGYEHEPENQLGEVGDAASARWGHAAPHRVPNRPCGRATSTSVMTA